MKDWKETIREVMNEKMNECSYWITYHSTEPTTDNWLAHVKELESRLASLRNALEQFEKAVKDGIDIPCESCGRLSSPRYYCNICDNDE